jgi:hypothetical protein
MIEDTKHVILLCDREYNSVNVIQPKNVPIKPKMSVPEYQLETLPDIEKY